MTEMADIREGLAANLRGIPDLQGKLDVSFDPVLHARAMARV